ncbi:signaling lymphocytic activation molecule [Esox lucius]|uniref:Ig-like domain-containing protein n=1 Tax=Esox lucius TaxID=8010 RepID=A0A6Q2Z5J1_ESOLU|nr:signaling lymphocytic activation molecule [Esox lucius]
MPAGPFSYCFSQGILLLSILHYGVGEPLLIHKTVGDSVELPGPSPTEGIVTVVWNYGGKEIAEYKKDVKYVSSQLEGRLEMNPKHFSLTVRNLTLQDSGEFVVTGRRDTVQIPSKVFLLKVHEPVYNVVIHPNVRLLANHNCSVQMTCNASGSSNLTYTWRRGKEKIRDSQQIQFILSPAEGVINLICNASNQVSEKSASTTVSCVNETNPTEMLWHVKYIGIPVGGAVVVILIVAVVMYNRKGNNTDERIDNTIYTDVGDIGRVKDTRSNSDVNPMSIYETVDDRNIPNINPPQTVYDRITFGRPDAQYSY